MTAREHFLVGLVAILAVITHPALGIQCYKCIGASSNDDCSQPEHLFECGQIGYDVCQTSVSDLGTPNERITKKCAMGPCNLSHNQNNALGLGCSGTSCSDCCETDGCNYAGAPRQIAVSVPLMVLVLALIGAVYQW